MLVTIILEAVLILAALACAAHSLMTNRTPQGTVAWLLALFALPIAAVPLYFVFGRTRHGAYAQRLRDAGMAGRQAADASSPGSLGIESRSAKRLDAIEGLGSTRYRSGNAVEFLNGGQSTFDRMLEAIDQAEDYLLIQFYIFRDDELGRAFRERVLAAAERGVRCCLLYDAIGSLRTRRAYFDVFRRGGVQTAAFGSIRRLFSGYEPNFRNHRKAVICDGKVAFIGGHNVGFEYTGRDPAFGFWRDASLRIEGPVVQEVQRIFAQDWAFATGQTLELRHEGGELSDGLVAAYLSAGPADALETCSLFFVAAIGAAKRRLWITSPYFVPDPAVMAALKLAAARGVDVRVIVPDKPDHTLVWLAGFDFLEEVERAGVRAYRYTRGFLHEKVLLIDDDIACVGTANLDNRSLKLNFEATMIVADPVFASEVEAALQQDFADSREHMARDFQKRPIVFKAAVRAARLLSPIL